MNAPTTCRYFVTYSGVKLPLNLLDELDEGALRNRNTYFCAWFDAASRPTRIEKRVYGEIELLHVYRWREDGSLAEADITLGDEDMVRVHLDAEGRVQQADA